MHSTKKSVNLRIKNDLIIESKSYHINMSRVLEEKLTEILQIKREQAWLEQNRKAIESYNKRVEESGVFSDEIRKF